MTEGTPAAGGFTAYIHIPFCARRCPYCAFYSVALEDAAGGKAFPLRGGLHLPESSRRSPRTPFAWGRSPQTPTPAQYIDALEREFAARFGEAPPGYARTLYVGGGTPTVLETPLLARLLGLVQSLVGPETCEFSVEALPSTLTPEKAETLASFGVGRVTLGLQSTERAVLDGVGRAQEYDALPRALQYLRQAGISNIGIDLILGLPGETREGFNIRYLLDLGCPHISAYMLSIEEGTPFAEARMRGEIEEAPDWKARRNYTALCSALRRAGYEHYEVSNFALPGYACRHNLATWRGEALLGFGAGAVGTARHVGAVVRRHNRASLEEYCAQPEYAYREEIISAGDLYHECLLLGLRTCEGIPDDLSFAAAESDALREKLERFVRARLLCHARGRYRPTLRGMLWLDTILVELFLDGQG